ncbi:MAG: TIGR00730 family Rossman fold protein [Elusimicrobiota bacterium]
MIRAIVSSPTYRRAYQDYAFMDREELRPIRLQLELLKPEMTLTELDIRSTVVVFGSARIKAPEDARRRVRGLAAKLRKHPRSEALAVQLAAAERLLSRSRFYEEARKFAALVTRASQADTKRDYVIVTGGGPGIMEAANRGAFEAGGKSIGLNITLPHEQVPNNYVTPELCFQFHYFALRKMHFMMRAKAMAAFPGGFGTLDELFETLTLVQTHKKHSIPILLFGREFWSRVIDFNFLAAEGVISHEDLRLIRYVETAEEAWAAIQAHWRRAGGGPRKRKSLTAAHLDEPPIA